MDWEQELMDLVRDRLADEWDEIKQERLEALLMGSREARDRYREWMEIDVMIHDSTTSWQLHRSFMNDQLLSLNRFLTRESVAWGTRKSDRELRTLINFALEDMKEEGVVQEVVTRWLPMLPVSL